MHTDKPTNTLLTVSASGSGTVTKNVIFLAGTPITVRNIGDIAKQTVDRYKFPITNITLTGDNGDVHNISDIYLDSNDDVGDDTFGIVFSQDAELKTGVTYTFSGSSQFDISSNGIVQSDLYQGNFEKIFSARGNYKNDYVE